MSDLDLTAAVDAAAEAWLQQSFPDWQGASPYTQNALRKIMLPPIATAAPFIERCVRERVASEIEAHREAVPLRVTREADDPGRLNGVHFEATRAALAAAARIARGEAS
jgi:hypothetical protein